ncbi:hypothetical protein NW762_001550 [Fusarium torreyae]|uniref:Uncharacterized protein n=1 Tax=Fusarium torreyae TaxID=1237075 RepID=A0A9W8SEX0_9HYPO|nr:hypothetical protein NW762_001550 [Fusarium torreyae]
MEYLLFATTYAVTDQPQPAGRPDQPASPPATPPHPPGPPPPPKLQWQSGLSVTTAVSAVTQVAL